MRNITIKIEDEESKTSVSGTVSVDNLNNLYTYHDINGITEVAIQLNKELNINLNQDIHLSIPNALSTLPPGKEW
jgi:type II secretory pathway component HofQ